MEARSRRVLHVLDSLTPASGTARVVMYYITGIPSVTQDIAIYEKCDPDMEKTVAAYGGRVFRLPSVLFSLGRPFKNAFSKLLTERPYSIVHGHLLNSAFLYLKEAKHLGVPGRIIQAHSAVSSDTFIKTVRNDVLSVNITKLSNCLIAVSQPAAWNAYKKKITQAIVIYNGISAERFAYDPKVRQQTRRKLKIPEGTLCVGNVARFTRLKNHGFLLEVFKEILKRRKSVLILAGDGPNQEKMKQKAYRMGIIDSVRFLGARPDVELLYQAFDVFMLPSFSEGFGLAAVEAQCAGLSCIVSENVPREITCGNINFLPLGNVKLWADTALMMAAYARRDGSVGVRDAMLDEKTMCGRIERVYESILGGTLWADSSLLSQSSSQFTTAETFLRMP